MMMTLATIAAWVAWIVVVCSIDPARAGAAGFVFFYVSLSLAAVGTMTIAGTGIRVWMRREEIVSRHVSHAFRQAFLFAALGVVSLFLLSHGLFRWWSATLIILLLAVVELLFLSASRPRPDA